MKAQPEAVHSADEEEDWDRAGFADRSRSMVQSLEQRARNIQSKEQPCPLSLLCKYHRMRKVWGTIWYRVLAGITQINTSELVLQSPSEL